jgi:hypothetical protein
MPRLIPCVLALLLASSLPLAAAESVTRNQVLEAIRVFEANASGDMADAKPETQKNDAVARASNTILKYSLESDDVVVDLGPDAVPWCDVKKGIAELSNSGERGLLLAAYLAGCVKAQLSSGKQDANPYAGWTAMLKIYRAIKIREGVSIPEADQLLAHQNDGSLEAFSVEASRRSAERLRKTYGTPAGQPKDDSGSQGKSAA